MIIREQPRWQELTQDISGAAIEALGAGLLIRAEIRAALGLGGQDV